jgi:cytochrome c556
MPGVTSLRLLAAGFAALMATASLSGTGLAPAAAQSAAGTSQATIAARQANFKAIAGAFKAVRGELEKDAPDYALIAAKAGDINARARRIGGLFPAGTGPSSGLKTEALAAIWKQPAAFKAANQKLVDESARLASTAAKRNRQAVAAQAMALGGSCKACHDQFRLESR